MYADNSALLAIRAERFLKYLKDDLAETEILVVTHGSFAHFLFNQWAGEPGKTRSMATQLQFGQVNFATIPGPGLPGHDLMVFKRYLGPGYPVSFNLLDYSPEVRDHGARDCGVFTSHKMQSAEG
jgi:broad specificity phosphatase PhoE